ncbi:hypothetical protein AVEN_16110-1 [Araneus ventricosus]|uniref:Integrase catalytic domain-containing protein n=1 Tax=Araneus ventricosus TaxID=182803 RepID=A0A4Y2RSM9_ARAVE|nr:hypothetical protein AVEN_16110-1 [Araneus ventricosus]
MALDILGPFPVTTKGNRYVLVLMHYYTKWPEVIPIPYQEASTVAEEVVQSWISCYGVPMILHSCQASVRVHSMFEKTTDHDIGNSGKKWLVYAKDREEGRSHRIIISTNLGK